MHIIITKLEFGVLSFSSLYSFLDEVLSLLVEVA